MRIIFESLVGECHKSGERGGGAEESKFFHLIIVPYKKGGKFFPV